MPFYILDTDHITLSQHDHPNVTQHIAELELNYLATTIISFEEQIRGRLNVIKRCGSGSKLPIAYANLLDSFYYFNSITILPFDQIAYDRYLALRQQKIRIGTQDLRIAAIVLRNDGILVTRNWRDFSKVPNLRMSNWASE